MPPRPPRLLGHAVDEPADTRSDEHDRDRIATDRVERQIECGSVAMPRLAKNIVDDARNGQAALQPIDRLIETSAGSRDVILEMRDVVVHPETLSDKTSLSRLMESTV